MTNFFTNMWNIVPGVIGTIQAVLPLIKDLIVLVVRIIAILPFLCKIDEPIIKKVNEIYDVIYGWVEKIKNAILLIK